MSHLLCVDIGNTHIVLALMQNENLLASTRIPSTPLLSDKDYRDAIEDILISLSLGKNEISGSVISSVVPRLSKPLERVCTALFNDPALIIDYTLAIDLKIKYADPSEVGADRICNALGAKNRYPSPLIVVDMGTATSFDIVSRNNEYLGGVIMPGLETAGRDLFERAAKLPKVSFEFPKKVVGKNTRESMQAGLMWGTVDQIDGMIKRISDEWGEKDITVIATGGLSEVIAEHSFYIKEVNKTLTLLGMIDIFKQVRRKT
ncbi:MAG: type III pantothenate kinase [Candidatus Neomarinimicrobiota bacterium]